MRTDVDHLPAVQRAELARVQDVLMNEFTEAIARSTSASRKSGKVYKIILFGSYARDDWVDEPENGYQSDFDLLIVVSHRDLTDIEHYWYVAEDKILRDASIGRPVNIIVHALDEVNQSLGRGEYFWVDIARDGIALYELHGHSLATPKALTAADALEMANAYFVEYFESSRRFLVNATENVARGWNKEAAFLFHQAAERLYICFLLVRTLYFPRSHNLKFLRSLSEDKEPRLISAWPREARLDRRRFELLKRAYVEARYSASYEISTDDLEAIATSVRALRDIVEQASLERIEALRQQAGA
jgi:uncharacterized protein